MSGEDRRPRPRRRRSWVLTTRPWVYAPVRIWTAPSLAAAVIVAGAVAGISAASRPLFVSSAGNGALAQGIRDGCAFDMGLHAQRNVAVGATPTRFGAPPYAGATRALQARVAGIGGLDARVATLTTLNSADVTVRSSLGRSTLVQLVSRTGAEHHISVVATVPAPGVWLADNTAHDIRAAPGSRVTLNLPAGAVPVTVHGVYRDLARVHRDKFWCSQDHLIDSFGNHTPPVLALFDEPSLLRVLRAGRQPDVLAQWEYAPDAPSWTLPRARRSIAQLRGVVIETADPSTPLGRLLGPGAASVDQQLSLPFAERSAADASAVVGPVALGTTLLALLALAFAARTWIDRRRQELSVLTLRGVGPLAIASKGVAELAPALLVGAGAGTVAGVLAVKRLGPIDLLDHTALVDAVRLVAVGAAVALLAVFGVLLVGARGLAVQTRNVTFRERLLAWEPAVVVAAAAAYYELRRHGVGPAGGQNTIDTLVLLFPVLLLLGASGLLARLIVSRRALGLASRALPLAGWLGARRVAARRMLAIPVVTGAAVAIGIVVFAGSLRASLTATVHAKTTLGPGAAQVVVLDGEAPIPRSSPLASRATEVTRATENGDELGRPLADVLGVDTRTFTSAAYWDGSFASRSLPSLIAAVRTTARAAVVPVIAVGPGLPETFTMHIDSDTRASVSLAVRVAARARAFPGYQLTSERPLVVLDRTVLLARGVHGITQVWLNRDDTDAARALQRAGIPVAATILRDDRLVGELRPQLWTVDYVRFVGLVAGAVPLAGLGLYFAVGSDRRRLGIALARRMGLRRRAAAASTATEIALMLVTGLVLGVLGAWAAIALVYSHIDPEPEQPPAALLRVDGATAAWCLAGVAIITVATTILLNLRSSRGSLAEVLRRAT